MPILDSSVSAGQLKTVCAQPLTTFESPHSPTATNVKSQCCIIFLLPVGFPPVKCGCNKLCMLSKDKHISLC